MSSLVLNKEFGLYQDGDNIFCSSLQIAEAFEKRHFDVIKSIKNVECSREFSQRNFSLSNYRQRGKEYSYYLLTKKGFMFLVLGYSGKKASMIREAYIEKFESMESYIKSLIIARQEYPELTEAIRDSHDEPKSYHYSNEANMINKIVLGCSAKQIRCRFGIKKGESIRPYLNSVQIKWIEKLQRKDVCYIEDGVSYEDRKAFLTAFMARQKPTALPLPFDFSEEDNYE